MRYLNRLSGPFLDRFDLSIEVPLLPQGSLQNTGDRGETSQQVREKVLKVREIQLARAGKINAYLSSKEIERDCKLQDKDALFLENALNKLGLSVRAYHRILKVSRTIADLNGEKRNTTISFSRSARISGHGSVVTEIVYCLKIKGRIIRPFLSSILSNKNVHHAGVLLRLVRLLVHLGKVRPIVSLHHLLR